MWDVADPKNIVFLGHTQEQFSLTYMPLGFRQKLFCMRRSLTFSKSSSFVTARLLFCNAWGCRVAAWTSQIRRILYHQMIAIPRTIPS